MKLIMENWKRFLREGSGHGLTALRSAVLNDGRKGFTWALEQALKSDRSLEGDPIELWADAGEFKAHAARGKEEIGVDYVITKGDLNFIVKELKEIDKMPDWVGKQLKELAAKAPMGETDFKPMDDALKQKYITFVNAAGGAISMADEPSDIAKKATSKAAAASADWLEQMIKVSFSKEKSSKK